MSGDRPVRLLILGTGDMANAHARGFGAIAGAEVVGAAEPDDERRHAFCRRHGIARAFTSLADALSWGAFDAVSNVTPDGVHHETTLQALEAGKHVFCEKPLATDHMRAGEMADAAERAGLVGMVNLTYRNVPHLHVARELVAAGRIGAVRHVEASYRQAWLVSNAWGDWRTEPRWLWRLSRAHGSNGTLGDIGIHILDFACYGAASEVAYVFGRQEVFHKAPDDRIGDYQLDANDSFTMSLQFANGALGVVHATRWAPGHTDDLSLKIYGEKGAIEVSRTPERSRVRVCMDDDVHTVKWRSLRARKVPTNYARFIAAIEAGATHEPSFRHAAKLQRVLDASMVAQRVRCEQVVWDGEENGAARRT